VTPKSEVLADGGEVEIAFSQDSREIQPLSLLNFTAKEVEFTYPARSQHSWISPSLQVSEANTFSIKPRGDYKIALCHLKEGRLPPSFRVAFFYRGVGLQNSPILFRKQNK
jgi:hypothetical protein